MTSKGEMLYSGKAKNLYRTSEDDVLLVEYMDQATAFNGEKKDMVRGKGALNNQITSLVFEVLSKNGIANHFVSRISDTEQTVRPVKIVPLEVVVRNIAAGSISKRLGITEGTRFPFPVVEFYFKDDDLGDPLINNEHIRLLDIATPTELDQIRADALRVNQVLKDLFDSCEMNLVDFKLEFGRLADGTIILADEVSPDTCRLWDKGTGDHLDKDVYRRDIGDLIPVYEKVLNRLEATIS